MTAIWFLLGVPLAVELIAAILSFRDCIGKPGLSAFAIEQLIVPVLLLGVAMWLATPEYWLAILAAFLFVLGWQLVLHVATQVVTRRKSLSSQVLDTDQLPT